MVTLRLMKGTSLLLFLILFVSTCTPKESLHIGGSSTVLPIVTQAAEHYRSQYPEKSIIVNSGGSGVGISQVGKGQLQIGMISRSITEEEMSNYPDVNFTVHVIGKDAVMAVVSSEIYESGVNVLSLKQIKQIYEGSIQNWSEVGGPDREILVVDKEKSRGTRHAFMRAVMGDEQASAPGADLVLGSNNELQLAVSQSDAAIGLLSFAWQTDKVKALSMKKEDGRIVEPTEQNIVDGKIPTVRELQLITDGKPEGSAADFIDYLLSAEGQQIVNKAGYVRINK